MTNNDNEIRGAAQSLYENLVTMNSRSPQYSSLDLTRSHSINLITEEFLGGYTQDGRMSVVRRFFCLFATFDLFFISLLWLICILITGDNIYNALKTQVLNYTIYDSLFDVVMVALCRFVVLVLFYGCLYINHWCIIALSTSGSCMFLISKVFVFNWVKSHEPVFEVVLIVTSFVLAWGEAWFLDCRVIPQERNARNLFSAITANNYTSDRSPLVAPFLAEDAPPVESHSTFYSPYDTNHNSDEEDEKDDEFKKMGKETVRRAYDLLHSSEWKVEKVTSKGDQIQSMTRPKLGKIYRLTAIVKYPAKPLLKELFYKIAEVPKWNPTLLESKIIRKIDTHTDISYQATVGGGGGLVKSRDFVNLRCWHLCRNGEIVDSDEDESDDEKESNLSYAPSTAEGSVSTVSDEEFLIPNESNGVKKSISDARLRDGSSQNSSGTFNSLSKSLGAKDFRRQFDTDEPPPLDVNFSDASNKPDMPIKSNYFDKIYISAAVSVPYAGAPSDSKYVRGENLISCWAMRETFGKTDSCIFEWVFCIDLKVYLPRYALDQVYNSLMQDYMTYLRKYVKELRQKRRKVPERVYS